MKLVRNRPHLASASHACILVSPPLMCPRYGHACASALQRCVCVPGPVAPPNATRAPRNPDGCSLWQDTGHGVRHVRWAAVLYLLLVCLEWSKLRGSHLKDSFMHNNES
uniref:Uncharacterized protein n=1 Tax=Eutreptiella gymnastica TaxID=73025 RepID=A0A7S1NBR7_9EUGL